MWLLACGMLWSGAALPVGAAITAEHRKEIGEIRKELNKVQGHITKKEFDEARKILKRDSQDKISKIASDAKVMESDKSLAPILHQIELKRAILDKKAGGAGDRGIDFAKEVAPILAAKCANCHNEDRSAGQLKFDTFAGLEAGGENKPLLVPGQGAAAAGRATEREWGAVDAQEPAARAVGSRNCCDYILVEPGSEIRRGQGPEIPGSRPGRAASQQSAPADHRPRQWEREGLLHEGHRSLYGQFVPRLPQRQQPPWRTESVDVRRHDERRAEWPRIPPGNMEGSRLFRLVGGLELPPHAAGAGPHHPHEL